MSTHPLLIGELVNPTTALNLFRINTIELMARDLGTVQSWSARGRFSKATNSSTISHYAGTNNITNVPFTYAANQLLTDGVASSRYSTFIVLYYGSDVISSGTYDPRRMQFDNMVITRTLGSKTIATPYYYSYTGQGDASASVGVYHVETPINTITGATVNVNRIDPPGTDTNDSSWVHSALLPGRWRLRNTVIGGSLFSGTGNIPIYSSGGTTIQTVQYREISVIVPPASFFIYANSTDFLDQSTTLRLYDTMLGSTFTYQHCVLPTGIEAIFERNVATGVVGSSAQTGSGRIFCAVNTTSDTKTVLIRMPSIIRRTVSSSSTDYTVPESGAAFVFEPAPLFNINPEPTGPLYSPTPSESGRWTVSKATATSTDGAYLTFTQHGLVYSGSSRQTTNGVYDNETIQDINWSHPSWYQFGAVTNVGYSYWIRATVTGASGGGVQSGTFGAWLPLTSEVRWGLNNPVSFVAPINRTRTLTIDLATDAAGTNIVASWTNVTLQVTDLRGI